MFQKLHSSEKKITHPKNPQSLVQYRVAGFRGVFCCLCMYIGGGGKVNFHSPKGHPVSRGVLDPDRERCPLG